MISNFKRALVLLAVVIGIFALQAAPALAAGEEHAGPAVKEVSSGAGWVAVGAGLAIGVAGIGTGIAQSRIGAAGLGALAENPKLLGNVILLVAIPETIVIFGFLIAFLLMGKF